MEAPYREKCETNKTSCWCRCRCRRRSR